MKAKRYIGLGVLAVVLLVAPGRSQQVGTNQQVSPVQINPPGQAFTNQTYWSLTGVSGGAAAITLTQPAQAGKFNYCTGFEVSGGGASGAAIIAVTLASGGTTVGTWYIAVPNATTAAATPLVVQFPEPVSGLAAGQTMVLTVASFGSGNLLSGANIRGFYQ
jgi:hypothetical protein